MQERPLNTDDLAGASGAEPVDDTGQPVQQGQTSPTDRPDLSVVQGGNQPDAGTGVGQSLFPQEMTNEFRQHWQDIQASFVDQPRQAVEEADALVADLLQRLAASFSDERKRLEGQWERGSDVSTEDLRVALTRYRSFFDRLLAA